MLNFLFLQPTLHWLKPKFKRTLVTPDFVISCKDPSMGRDIFRLQSTPLLSIIPDYSKSTIRENPNNLHMDVSNFKRI